MEAQTETAPERREPEKKKKEKKRKLLFPANKKGKHVMCFPFPVTS